MVRNKEDTTNFVPAHRDFRVIAIGTPVRTCFPYFASCFPDSFALAAPFPGFPLDPPFRSRFQSRYLDPLASSQVLAKQAAPTDPVALELVHKTGNAISAIQITKEMRPSSLFLPPLITWLTPESLAGTKMASGVTSSEDVPGFPQTSLLKLARFLTIFPPPHASLSTPSQFANLLLAIHPSLSYITPPSWGALEAAFEGAGLGEWSTGVAECDPADVGLLGEGIWGWRLASIERSGERSAKVTFVRGGGAEKLVVDVPAGPRPFAPFPLQATPTFHLTPRFEHLLASLFQLHALGRFDISVLPPSSSLQSSSSSTTVLIATFAQLLGYELETIHLYKELGGREIWMRRVVDSGVGGGKAGVTGWEPSPLVKGAWEGKLVHLEGIDALGATVGSLGRLLGEREGELWEGKRLVGGEPLSVEEVSVSR